MLASLFLPSFHSSFFLLSWGISITPEAHLACRGRARHDMLAAYSVQFSAPMQAQGCWVRTQAAAHLDPAKLNQVHSPTHPPPQVNTESSGGVESVANVTDIHEALDFAGGRWGCWVLGRVGGSSLVGLVAWMH